MPSSFGSLSRLRTLFRCMAKVRMKLIFASSVGWKVKPPKMCIRDSVYPAQQFVVAGGVAGHAVLTTEGLRLLSAPLSAAEGLDLEGAFRPCEPRQMCIRDREHHFGDNSMPATRGMYRIGG